MRLGYGVVAGRPVARVEGGIVPLNRSIEELVAAGPDVWRATADVVLAAEPRPLEGEPELPLRFGDVFDFYASIDHATNMGRILRPGSEPLLPNWRHLPVGYVTRSGGVAVSGTAVRRPVGLVGPGDRRPTERLDLELEVGFVVGGEGRLVGAVLVNDWSARDIQAFEYQPLGPLLGKSFLTTVSPWIVPIDLLPRVDGAVQDPVPDPVLQVPEPRGFDVDLVVELNGRVVAESNLGHLYWSPDQLLAHLTSNGSLLRPGDLLATGTVSGPTTGSRGCLMEQIADGTSEGYLQDGDEVVLRSSLLGECAGTVEGA